MDSTRSRVNCTKVIYDWKDLGDSATNLDWALAEEHLLLWEYLLQPSAKTHVVYGSPKKTWIGWEYASLTLVKEWKESILDIEDIEVRYRRQICFIQITHSLLILYILWPKKWQTQYTHMLGAKNDCFWVMTCTLVFHVLSVLHQVLLF